MTSSCRSAALARAKCASRAFNVRSDVRSAARSLYFPVVSVRAITIDVAVSLRECRCGGAAMLSRGRERRGKSEGEAIAR